MNLRRNVLLAGAALLALTGAKSLAKSTVTVKDVHICCGACVRGIETALKDVDGVSAKIDRKAATVIISATDDAAAQKALDAMAAAGFHGTTDSDKLAMKNDSGVGADKTKQLTLTGVHNCCAGCANAAKKACAAVDGVKTTNLKSKEETFVVEGDFSPAALVKALNAAGFHVRVKK